MRTFYIISETEMKEVGAPPVCWEDSPSELCIYCSAFASDLAAAPVFQHRLNKKGLVSEEDFRWREWCSKYEQCDCAPNTVCQNWVKVAIPKGERLVAEDSATYGHKLVEAEMKRFRQPPKEEKEERTWPFNGYAPGNYQNTCTFCKKGMIADKLCFVCLECAVKKARNYIRTLESELLTKKEEYAKGLLEWIVSKDCPYNIKSLYPEDIIEKYNEYLKQ